MSGIPDFSSVPGMAVPGNLQPGRDGQPSPLGAYQYLGQLACFYLDYLDVATGRTLAPVPGNYYTMVVASGRAAYLTVPPPGRPWNPGDAGAGGTFAPLAEGLFSRPLTLAEARTGLERQRNESGWHQRLSVPAPQPPPPAQVPPPPPPPAPTALHHARARLEESRAAHGHYAPGGCKTCMSGG